MTDCTSTAAISTWLKYLRSIVPPSGIVLVGAGSGSGAWVQALIQWAHPNTILVEAEETRYEHLKQAVRQCNDWQLSKLLVVPDSERYVFYRASNPAESGIIDPEMASALWPNLKRTETITDKPSSTLQELLKENQETPNWVILDCFPAARLLKGAADMLWNIDVVIMRVPVHETGSLNLDLDSGEARAWLSDCGFRPLTNQSELHPSVAHMLYIRDMHHLKKSTHLQMQRLDAVSSEKHKLESFRREQEKSICEQEERIVRAESKLAEERKKTELQAKYIDELEAEKEALKETGAVNEKRRNELQKRIEKFEGDRDGHSLHADDRALRLIHNVVSDIDRMFKKEIGDAVRQIEAMLNIQTFFEKGECLPQLHGWSVSSDAGLYIMNLIDENNYDLILEFGSGSSTVLIAKTLIKLTKQRTEDRKCNPVQVAFEHHEKYYEKTVSDLRRAGLEKDVRLVLAPLQPYIAPDGGTYFFYSCHSTLRKLSEQFGKKRIKLFVLVDGPPGIACKHARYPAVPSVLSMLGKADIDVLLDDYLREDEKEIVPMWMKDIDAMGLKVIKEEKEMRKGACLLRIRS